MDKCNGVLNRFHKIQCFKEEVGKLKEKSIAHLSKKAIKNLIDSIADGTTSLETARREISGSTIFPVYEIRDIESREKKGREEDHQIFKEEDQIFKYNKGCR
jgi:hypothetical protein